MGVRVLLAVVDIVECDELEKALLRYGIEVVEKTDSGADAYQYITELKPEVAVVDLCLPEIDGISLMEKIQGMKYKTEVIMVSGIRHPAMIERANRLGVFSYHIKPYDLASVCKQVRLAVDYYGLAPLPTDRHENAQIRNRLSELGVRLNSKGMKYLTYMISEVLSSTADCEIVYKDLVHRCGQFYGVTEGSVERAVRVALSTGDTRVTRSQEWVKLFGGGAVTSKSFLLTVINAMREE